MLIYDLDDNFECKIFNPRPPSPTHRPNRLSPTHRQTKRVVVLTFGLPDGGRSEVSGQNIAKGFVCRRAFRTASTARDIGHVPNTSPSQGPSSRLSALSYPRFELLGCVESSYGFSLVQKPSTSETLSRTNPTRSPTIATSGYGR